MKCSHRCVYLIRPLGGQTSSGDKKRHGCFILSGSSHAVTRVVFIRGVKQQSSGLNVNRTLLKVFVSVNFVRFFPRDQIAGILSVFVVNIVKEKFHGFFSVTFLSVISRKINQTRHICSSRKKKNKTHLQVLFSPRSAFRWVSVLEVSNLVSRIEIHPNEAAEAIWASILTLHHRRRQPGVL